MLKAAETAALTVVTSADCWALKMAERWGQMTAVLMASRLAARWEHHWAGLLEIATAAKKAAQKAG